MLLTLVALHVVVIGAEAPAAPTQLVGSIMPHGLPNNNAVPRVGVLRSDLPGGRDSSCGSCGVPIGADDEGTCDGWGCRWRRGTFQLRDFSNNKRGWPTCPHGLGRCQRRPTSGACWYTRTALNRPWLRVTEITIAHLASHFPRETLLRCPTLDGYWMVKLKLWRWCP